MRTAINQNIKYIFYAEHGESEYGGLILDEENTKKRKFQEVIEHGIGDYPENWIDDNISSYDIEPYVFPNEEILNKNYIHSHYFSYYFKWSINDNYRYVKKFA